MTIILMGVAGSGKTTVGKLLAERLGWGYFEGDNYHPEANVRKMSQGHGLTDDDRWPWLEALREMIEEESGEGRSAVLACSALKRAYRRKLRPDASGVDVRFVYLEASRELIQERLSTREGHYAGVGLLESQFEALEPPHDALAIDATLSPSAILDRIIEELGLE